MPVLDNSASSEDYNPPNGCCRAVANTVFDGYNLLDYMEANYNGD
jgi:hypothetical protein